MVSGYNHIILCGNPSYIPKDAVEMVRIT